MSYTPVKGYWQGNAVANAPDLTKLTSQGYPANGDPSKGQPATIPGAAWYYWIDQAIRSVITASGKTCANPPTADEFLEALKSLGWIANGSIDPEKIDLASLIDSSLSTTSTNAVQNKVVKSSIDTLTTSVNAKLPLAGGNITGSLSIGGVEVVPVANNAAAHNGIYRGANLAQWYTIEQLSTKVQAGDWSNLFIGDYYDITMTTSYKSNETVRWQIAGFDTEYGQGSGWNGRHYFDHHLAMIPRDVFDTYAKMNETNTTEGGYSGSYMANTVLPIYATALKEAIGESHVLSRKVWRTNTVTTTVANAGYAGFTGASSGGAWVDEELGLLSEVQVFGCLLFSSSCYDAASHSRQLPLFALGQDLLVSGPSVTDTGKQTWNSYSRYTWWLGSVVSSTSFAHVSALGNASCDSASSAYGVRPLFLFH